MDIKIINILKIVDVLASDIPQNILEFMQRDGVVLYKDQLIKEDIYNIDDTIEAIGGTVFDQEIYSWLQQLSEKMDDVEASYLIIVYH